VGISVPPPLTSDPPRNFRPHHFQRFIMKLYVAICQLPVYSLWQYFYNICQFSWVFFCTFCLKTWLYSVLLYLCSILVSLWIETDCSIPQCDGMLMLVWNLSWVWQTFSLHCVQKKKHPLTFSFISLWMMCGFKQKLQWIYLGTADSDNVEITYSLRPMT